MNDFLENLKREAVANPILALGVAAGVITSISQLIRASTNASNAKAWKIEVARRAAKDAAKAAKR